MIKMIGKGHYKKIIEEEVINLMASFFYSSYNEKVLIIILIKNESEIGYKITLGRVRKEELIELELKGIGGEGVCG